MGLAVGVAAAAALAVQAAPASALTKFDGVWTISHGATGQVVFNGDNTYSSTCQPIPNFPATNCPSPSGTFTWNTGSAYLKLTGSDGRAMSFRMGGPVVSPTSLSGGGGAGTYSGIIIDRGTSFKCSTFYDSAYTFAKGPLVYKSGSTGFALGSNQSVGAINAGNYVFLAERSPGYFVKGSC
ncbi:MAG: hypothetical protein AB7W59_08285 [Acidimicrobiia bacterium]